MKQEIFILHSSFQESLTFKDVKKLQTIGKQDPCHTLALSWGDAIAVSHEVTADDEGNWSVSFAPSGKLLIRCPFSIMKSAN